MATFQDLEIDKFYLVRFKDGEDIKLVQPAMATNRCVLVFEFREDGDSSYWKMKEEGIAEIVEEMLEDKIEEYETLILEDYDDFDYEEVKDGKKKKKKKKK